MTTDTTIPALTGADPVERARKEDEVMPLRGDIESGRGALPTPTSTELPRPKYHIGQTVWRASTEAATAQHPCPDCFNSQKWTVTTPAGATLEAACQRCGGYTGRDLPSLTYVTTTASVRRLTVGSIQIDTAPHYSEAVRYMCRETGIGSGSVYDESSLHETEEEARRAADTLAALANTERAALPENLQKARFAYLTLKDAVLERARNALWDSWRAYRFLREDLERFVEEEPGETLQDMRDNLKHALEFEREYRDPHPLDALVAAARKHLATHPVFRTRPTGGEGSAARLSQIDAIATEDALIAALAVVGDGGVKPSTLDADEQRHEQKSPLAEEGEKTL